MSDKKLLRFMIDESSGIGLFKALISEGYDTQFAGNIMAAAKDSIVLDYAEREKRILITNDKDFGELIFRLHKPSSGVILLRLKIDTPQTRRNYLLKVIKLFGDKLFSNFIVVREDRIRIRKA